MRKWIKVLFAITVWYLVGTFYFLSFNIVNWSSGGRFLIVSFMLISSIVVYFTALFDDTIKTEEYRNMHQCKFDYLSKV